MTSTIKRIVLTEGDSVDIQYASVDFYSCGPFHYDDPENIGVSAGNGYIVGQDIPAGTYSGYAEGEYGVSITIYESLGGNFVDYIFLEDGAKLGKTILKDGYAITVDTGVLHLTPFN